MKYVYIKAEKWSKNVKKKWNPPEGFFKRSQGEIAKGLKSYSDDLKQAMSRLNFYINRAGRNLPANEKKRLDGVKPLLRKAFGK